MALRTKWRSGDDFLVRHVDKSIIIVEKRAGLLTHTTEGKQEPNLHEMLRSFIRGRGPQEIFSVHRLDRVVSGLLVYARRRDVQGMLIQQFAAHDVERVYAAVASGKIRDEEGTFESDLVTDHKSLRVFSAKRSATTKHAVTHWRVVERLKDATLLDVRLETGVRNQIRVHFAEAGHPLLGERKYADRNMKEQKQQKTQRIFLHAKTLGFVHPFTKKTVRFDAPLPPDLAKWKKMLTASAPRSPS